MGGASSAFGSWGAGGGASSGAELSRAGLSPSQANSLGVNVVGPGQTPTSGVLGGLSNLTSGATQGLYGNQGPGVTNAILQTLGGLAGSRIMGGNPLAIGVQGLGNIYSQSPIGDLLSQSPVVQGVPPLPVSGPATTPGKPGQSEPRGRILGRHENVGAANLTSYPGAPQPGPGDPATTPAMDVPSATSDFRRHGSIKELIQAYLAGTTKG